MIYDSVTVSPFFIKSFASYSGLPEKIRNKYLEAVIYSTVPVCSGQCRRSAMDFKIIKNYITVTKDPGVDGRIKLKLIFKKWDGGHGLD
jgi:hypothetical protein